MGNQPWKIDAAHSGIHFSVRHMLVSKVRGRFAKFGGTIELDEEDVAKSRIDVEIDAASVDTGIPERDAHLRSPDFFDAAAFPLLRFRSRSVEPQGGDRFRVLGDLTIHGVTREVTLDVVAGGRARDPWGQERSGFEASASIDRRDFGLQWNQLLEAGGVLVGNEVQIAIELEAVRSAAQQAA
jgi:polyisoprenoid-binding protein YceI